MDVLAGTVGRQGLASEREVLAKTCVAVAVSALKAGKAHGALAPSHEPIGLGKVTDLHLPHQKEYIGRYEVLVGWETNKGPVLIRPGGTVGRCLLSGRRRRRRAVGAVLRPTRLIIR